MATKEEMIKSQEKSLYAYTRKYEGKGAVFGLVFVSIVFPTCFLSLAALGVLYSVIGGVWGALAGFGAMALIGYFTSRWGIKNVFKTAPKDINDEYFEPWDPPHDPFESWRNNIANPASPSYSPIPNPMDIK